MAEAAAHGGLEWGLASGSVFFVLNTRVYVESKLQDGLQERAMPSSPFLFLRAHITPLNVLDFSSCCSAVFRLAHK